MIAQLNIVKSNNFISGIDPIDLSQLDHDFFFHLGEKVSNGMSVTNEANLIKDFMVAHPKEKELILSQWNNLKKLLLGECTQKTIEFILPKEYVRWLRFSDYKPIYDNYYSSVETIPVMIDVKDLYEDVIDGTTGLFRTTCKKFQEESINSIIIDDCIDIETSTFVQKLKKKYPAVKYLSYSEWKSIQDEEEQKERRRQIAEIIAIVKAKAERLAKAEAERLAKEEAERLAKDEEERRKTEIKIEMVDLGLNVCWASCNIGAVTPFDIGNYYSSKDILKLKLDKCYIPSEKDVTELITKCQFRINYNPRKACEVIGPNGKRIFFPLTGYMVRENGDKFDSGNLGYYWLNTYREDGRSRWFVTDQRIVTQFRNFFCPIRMVCKNNTPVDLYIQDLGNKSLELKENLVKDFGITYNEMYTWKIPGVIRMGIPMHSAIAIKERVEKYGGIAKINPKEDEMINIADKNVVTSEPLSVNSDLNERIAELNPKQQQFLNELLKVITKK